MGLCKRVTLWMGVGFLYYNERSRRVPGVSRARQGTFCHDNRHKGEETTTGPGFQNAHSLLFLLSNIFGWHNLILYTVFLLSQMQKTKSCLFILFNRFCNGKLGCPCYISLCNMFCVLIHFQTSGLSHTDHVHKSWSKQVYVCTLTVGGQVPRLIERLHRVQSNSKLELWICLR